MSSWNERREIAYISGDQNKINAFKVEWINAYYNLVSKADPLLTNDNILALANASYAFVDHGCGVYSPEIWAALAVAIINVANENMETWYGNNRD
jgi:hypothetical protein